MSYMLSSALHWFGVSSSPAVTKHPDKPSPSPSPEPDLSPYNRQIGLLGPWSITTATKALICDSTVWDAVHASSSPTIPAEVGAALGLAGCAFALAEAALSWHGSLKLLLGIKAIRAQKAQYKPGAKAFEADKAADRANKGALEGAKRGESAIKEKARPSHAEISLASPQVVPSERSLSSPIPTHREEHTPALANVWVSGAEAHRQYRDAKMTGKQQIKAAISNAIAFVRDGVFQPGSVGLSIAAAAKTYGGTAIQVAGPAAGIAGGGLAVASGGCQITQGIVDCRESGRVRRIAKDLREKMTACLNCKGMLSFRKLAASREGLLNEEDKLDVEKFSLLSNFSKRFGKYSDAIAKFKRESLDEYRHVQEVYKAFYVEFISNQNTKRSEQKKERSHAKKRIAYGIASVAVGAAIIGLAATGVGAVAILAVGGGLLLAGGIWLAYNAHRMGRQRAQASLEAKSALVREKKADALSGKSLATLEKELKTASFNNRDVAARVLARHLGGGKAEAKGAVTKDEVSTAKQTIAEKTANANKAFEKGLGATIITAEGLKIRREFASLFLLRTGMSQHDIDELKILLADGKEAAAVNRIKRFLSGDGGRVLWKPLPTEGIAVPV